MPSSSRRVAGLLLALLVSGLLWGCQSTEPEPGPMAMQAPMAEADRSMPGEAKRMASAPQRGGSSSLSGSVAPMPGQHRPMLARRASVTLRVKDVAQALEGVGKQAQARGGYIEESFINRVSEAPSGRAVARVPEKALDAFLVDLDGLGTVERRHLSSEDVGEEVVDLERRIANWRAQEARLVQLFQRAGRVTDLLEVERELSRVRGEIERAVGRAQYLERLVALSTVEVELFGLAAPNVPVGWNLGNEVRAAGSALLGFLVGLMRLGIWAVIFAPIWIPALLIGRWAWRRKKARA